MLEPLQEINMYRENKKHYTHKERKIILLEIEKSLQKISLEFTPL